MTPPKIDESYQTCSPEIEEASQGQPGVLNPAYECEVSIDADVCPVEEEQLVSDVFVSVSPQEIPCFSEEAGVDLEEVACTPTELALQGSEGSLLQASAALAVVQQGGQRTVTQTVARTAPRALAYSFETGEIISTGAAVETGAGLGFLETIGILGYGLIFLLPLIDIQDSPKKEREPVIPITGVDVELDPESDLDEDLDVDSFNDGVMYRDLNDPIKSWDEASQELAQITRMVILALEMERRREEGFDTTHLEREIGELREAYARAHPSNQTIPSPQATTDPSDAGTSSPDESKPTPKLEKVREWITERDLDKLTPKVVTALTEVVENHSDPDAVTVTLAFLGLVTQSDLDKLTPEVVTTVAACMNHPDPDVVDAAIIFLSKVATNHLDKLTPEAVTAGANGVNHPDFEIARSALVFIVLVISNDLDKLTPEAVTTAANGVNHLDPEIVHLTATFLEFVAGNIPDKLTWEARESLADAAENHQDPDVARRAREVLEIAAPEDSDD